MLRSFGTWRFLFARWLDVFLFNTSLLATDQQRVRSRWSGDLLGLGTADRCNVQLEFLKDFNSGRGGCFIAELALRKLYCRTRDCSD